MFTKPPKPDYLNGCHCCSYETHKLTAYPRKTNPDGDLEGDWKWLCKLCAITLAGTKFEYPSENATMLAHICHIGNMIMAIPQPNQLFMDSLMDALTLIRDYKPPEEEPAFAVVENLKAIAAQALAGGP